MLTIRLTINRVVERVTVYRTFFTDSMINLAFR